MLARVVGEFEAVEQQGLAVDEADVAQMQVAVAAAHLAGGPAPFEQPSRRLHAGEPFFADPGDRPRREARLLRRHQAALVGLGNLDQRFSAAQAGARLGRRVEAGDVVGERIHQPGPEPARGGQRIE